MYLFLVHLGIDGLQEVYQISLHSLVIHGVVGPNDRPHHGIQHLTHLAIGLLADLLQEEGSDLFLGLGLEVV